MSQVRKAAYCQEWLPYERFPGSPYRWQESYYAHESSTLQVQVRWLRLRPAGEDSIRYRKLLIYTSFCKICGRHVTIYDLKRCSSQIGCELDTIKEIHSNHLKRRYSPPSLEGGECIGIDEFAVKKGHVYKTIVVDLASGRIIYVGEGKGVDALSDFWKRVKRKNISIKYVATDLSAAFIGSVLENCPDAIHVFDHFHVMKLMNDKLDDIRRI